MSKYALLFCALTSLAFAPAPLPKPDTGKDDLKKMLGTWELVSLTLEGKPLAPGGFMPRVVIASEWTSYANAKGELSGKWDLTLDTKKTPRAFIMTVPGTKTIGARGIYEFKGNDTLIRCLCINRDQPPPTRFDSNKPGHYLQVLRRLKR